MNHWDDPTIPKFGWNCDFVVDLKEDEDCEFEEYADCWMCGRERIRFVHHLSNDRYPDVIETGCICAGKLTGDEQGAKDRETKLKNKAQRRAKWLTRNWKISGKGHPRLKVGGVYVTVYQRGHGFSYCVDGEFPPQNYPTGNAAKLAAFDRWWERQEEFAVSPYNRKAYVDPAHASWGAFFSELGWNPEYKPSVVRNWEPTFRISGDDGDCLVRVELQYQINQQYFAWLENSLGDWAGENTVLVVGRGPYYNPNYNHPMLGWTNEQYEDGSSFDEAPFVTDKVGRFDFCHSSGSFRGRLTGYYDGGDWPLIADPLAKWAEARMKVR
jgi:hypothetical protein